MEEEEPQEEEEEDIPEEDEPAPTVELTEAEKKEGLKKSSGISDLTPNVLGSFFAKFSVPQKEEGFDDMRYEWSNAQDSNEYLRKWTSARKRTARIEELQPGQ